MVIELKAPTGPGLDLPYESTWRSSSLYGDSDLRRIMDAPYYEDFIRRATGPFPTGSLSNPSYGQLYDMLNPDPRKWTTIQQPTALNAPVLSDLGAKPSKGQTSKLGNFNLNAIRPFESLQDATTTGIGQAPAQYSPGEVVFGDIRLSPMDILNWSGELPIKLMERPLALVQTAANRVLGTPLSLDDSADAVYPFQEDPAYWTWLRTASEEQIVQFARAEAGNYLAAGRNDVLYRALLDRFQADRDAITGLSGGDKAIDFMAKNQAYQQYRLEQLKAQYPDKPEAELVMYQAGTDPLGQLWAGLKVFEAGLPFAGSWGNFEAGTEADAHWLQMSAVERQKALENAGWTSVAIGFMAFPPIFKGVTSLAALARGSAVPSIAKMAYVWDKTLRVAQVSMALGVVTTTAAWATETYAPLPEMREFGRDVNMGVPISHSTVGAILNQIGFFSSGTFGAALAIKGTWRGAGFLLRNQPGSFGKFLNGTDGWLWGTRETPFATVGHGGSEYRRMLFKDAGVPENISNDATASVLMNYVMKAEEADLMAVKMATEAGPTSGTPMDLLTPEALDVWRSDVVNTVYASRARRTVQFVQRWARLRQQLGLIPSTQEAITRAVDETSIRRVVDDGLRRYVTDYGPTFFKDRLTARASIQQTLTEMGYTPDMAALDRDLGSKDTVTVTENWRKMARLVHQIGYLGENARLRDAIAKDPGSTEEGLAIFSQRTAFEDEMLAAQGPLRKGDTAAHQLAAELIRSKTPLEVYYAAGALGRYEPGRPLEEAIDPVRLADVILEALDQNAFPKRRVQATDPATVGLPLNAFHKGLVERGKWELGFRSRSPIPAEIRFRAALDAELTVFELQSVEPSLVTIVDVVPDGYVELKPGQRFRRTNWPALKPIMTHEGRYFVLDDGSLNFAQATAGAAPPRPTNDPSNPRPFEPYASPEAERFYNTLTEEQQRLISPVTEFYGHGPVPASYNLEPTGEVVSGRNAGADWPVYREPTTDTKWIFKAQRPSYAGGELEDLSGHRQLAGPTATKLFEYLGLHTSTEAPYVMDGVRGTLQAYVPHTETIDLVHLERYTPEVRAELIKHHVVDWLTGQHDSNSDSFLVGDNGFIFGIDKGQAYKYMAEPESRVALLDPKQFWMFRTRDAADTHLGEYLYDAIRKGKITPSWTDVEPLLRQIEAMPEDFYLAALEPLAKVRVADGRFEKTVEQFYATALERKRAMRGATEAAFRELKLATLPRAEAPWWPPSVRGRVDIGTDVWLNDRPIAMDELLAYNAASPVAEPAAPATVGGYKAGVVIQEPDGKVWILHPKNSYGGYLHTWPKGSVEAGETYQAAAIREAAEELGLSVRLKAHLVDLPNEAGNITRYYLAERVGGGPEFVGTPKEVGLIKLVPENLLVDHLWRNGKPDPRDNAVVDALREHKAAQAAAPSAGATLEDGTPVMIADPAQEMGYISHVRFRNGMVVETPWLDPRFMEYGQIDLGNRGVMGHLFDDVFGTWRTWRLMETQKLNLHRALTSDYDITARQVESFATDLFDLSMKHRGVSIQALAGTPEVYPGIGAWAGEIRALAHKHFGTGPFLNRRTGRLDEIDFNREVVRAFRQSFRLNVIAGVTSYLKSMPGVGGFILPITDVVYPLVRYGLSFIFKPSEITESAVFGAMRGTFRSGDPFTDALYWRGGFGAGIAILQEERVADMMMQGLTAFSSPTSAYSHFGEAPFMFGRLDTAATARRAAEAIAPRTALPARQPVSGLGDSLTGGPLQLPDERFPDTYPIGAQYRHLLRRVGTDAGGNPILKMSGGEDTVRQVERFRGVITGDIYTATLANPEAAARYAAGFWVLQHLPAGTIERLAAAVPPMHTPTTTGGFARQVEHIEAAIKAGNPLFPGLLSTGKLDLALQPSETGRTVPQMEIQPNLNAYPDKTSISAPEQALGYADAKYGSMAATYGGGSRSLLVLLKPEALKKSITLDQDRISYESSVEATRDAMMTPAAVNAINRLIAQELVVEWVAKAPESTLLEYFQTHAQHRYGQTSPFELAFMGGIEAQDVAAVLVPSAHLNDWGALVAKHAGKGTGLEDIPVVPYDHTYLTAMWANAFERAGLLDLGQSKASDLGAFDMPGVAGLPPEILSDVLARPRAGISFLLGDISTAAKAAGFELHENPGFLDSVRLALYENRISAHDIENRLSNRAHAPSGRSTMAAGDLKTVQERVVQLEALLRDTEEHYAKGPYNKVSEAQAAGDDAWLVEDSALRARAAGLGVSLRSTGADLGRGNFAVHDVDTGEIVATSPIGAPEADIAFSGTFQPDADLGFQLAGARFLLEVMQARIPDGYRVAGGDALISRAAARAIAATIDTDAFRAALRARATAKLGTDPGEPVIRSYLRGPARHLTNAGASTKRGVDELLITVQDGSGLPYANLTPSDLAGLWQRYGFPADFRTNLEAAGWDPKGAVITRGVGGSSGQLFHSTASHPEGRIHFYPDTRWYGRGTTVKGQFEQTPLGREYVDTEAPFSGDVRFVEDFKPGASSYVDLTEGRTLFHDSIEAETAGATSTVRRLDEHGGVEWAYEFTRDESVTNAHITEARSPFQGTGSIYNRLEALRDLFSRAEPDRPVRLTVEHVDDRLAFEKLAMRGEVPDWLVAVDPMGVVIDRPAIAANLNPATAAVPVTPPPAHFDDVTPEGRLTEHIRDDVQHWKGKAGRALKQAFIDPVPYKKRQQDRLTFMLMRDRFAPYVKTDAPEVAKVFSELKVPEAKWLDFLVHDRYLLERWVETGARGDWEALVKHADTYLGAGEAKATTKILDELYANPNFDVLLSSLRMVMKGSQDEAYQVHFFAPFRSTFERSINHPLLGVYPASWAYKAAKEWIRFLFMNQTLGFRAGMVPAQIIAQITDAQAKAFAQHSDKDLAEWYQNGPYTNSIFIFQLLMPGDWSSLPFPFSRAIRDVARGNMNPYDLFDRNLAAIGLGRDIRLTAGAAGEVLDTLSGNIGQGRLFKKYGVSNTPGWSLLPEDVPAPAQKQAPSDIYVYR